MLLQQNLRPPIAIALAFLLAFPLVPAAAGAQQTTPSQQQGGTSSVPPPKPSGQNEGAPVTAPTPGNMQPPPAPQPAPAQSGPPAPVGTAAAPYEKGIGVAASRPAGVVVAPGKQRRTRSFLIRTGLIIGAAIAVGTVVALSNASPSQPH